MVTSKEILELSAQVKKACVIKTVSMIDPSIELSGDITLPYHFTCEALHPGTYRGIDILSDEIIKGKDTIFNSYDNFHNNEINKDHKNSRKPESSVSDLVGKVVRASYNSYKDAYILEGEIYDYETALKVHNRLWKYVSIRINPKRIVWENGRQVGKDLEFEELSFVRRPGDSKVRIL